MEKLKQKISELKELGFSEEQTNEIIKIAEEEILEKVLDEFTETAEDSLVNEYLQKVENVKNNPKKLSSIFDEIMQHLYGENIQEKKEQFLVENMQDVIDLTKETREVYKKYSQNDPETVKKIDQAQKDPNIAEINKLIKEDKG